MTTTESVYFLLVDDIEENLLALEELLRRPELVLLKARSGIEALPLLLKYDVALVLVDIRTPGMNGVEVAELIRGSERTRRVPIIFLTAGKADIDRSFGGYETGAVDFLQAPIEPDILRSKAGVFFELYRQRQEVASQRDELRIATDEISRLLKESNRRAQALKDADQKKDDFLAMLAHELRNPLAPVRNAVEILKIGTPTTATIAQASDIISRQVSHMARLVDDLLDVARIAHGTIPLRLKNCDLTAVVRQTAEDYRPTLAEARIGLTVTIADERLNINGDPTRLAQIIGNLLHNSSKFTPSGGHVDVLAFSEGDGFAAVLVRDSGAGMDQAVLSRVFEPFGQTDQSLDRGKGGLGLGLALVKGLIELHGGCVAAESPGPGRGSTFTLRLPLSDIAPTETTESNRPIPAVKCEPLRILLVEDNRDVALTLQQLLCLLGHEVKVAFDGKSGLEIAAAFRPDVVVSDLGLPGEVDGYNLAIAMKANPSLDRIYLIALSGYGQDEDRRRTRSAGFDRHLVKPVDLARLQDAFACVRRREAG